MDNKTDLGHLRFAPDILKRLGEELIPNLEQGIIEIVKNSYDADAKKCSIKLNKVKSKGGSIVISDNGSGMSKDDILDGFFMIGRSRKSPRNRTKRKRLTVGDKGLGRLAALRLGKRVIISSRPKAEPGTEYYAEIDWGAFDLAVAIEDVAIPILKRQTNAPQGTDIHILDLRRSVRSDEIKRLSRELLLLKDPFKDKNSFDVFLDTPEFESISKTVENSYFPYANYKLVAKIGSNGEGHAIVYDKGNDVAFETLLPVGKNKRYNIPPTEFEMWIWILSSEHFNENTVRLPEIREWLKSVGGVHVYHRGVRVSPYGDPGYDWLDMNLARARRPEEMPSTNNVLGRVIIRDPSLKLAQPTNRIGFVETSTFSEMKRFAKDTLEWLGKERLKAAEERRSKEKVSTPMRTQKALSELKEVIKYSTSSSEQKKDIESALEQYIDTKESEITILQDELQLYRSLATAGTTSAVFAHESSKPITIIRSSAKTLERRGRKFIKLDYDDQFKEPVDRIYTVAESLKSYSSFPLFHLKKAKRRHANIDINEVWRNIKKLFTPLLDKDEIHFTISESEEPAIVYGSIAMIESIATNLLTNSIHVLTKRASPSDSRVISVKIINQGNSVRVIHSDSGEGIKNVDIEKIWNPGETTSSHGTGFGLTIVRDSVSDLRGSVAVIPNGSLGGAEFYISLPSIIRKGD